MITSAELAMNGTRQPQARNCASLSDSPSSRNEPAEKKKPIGAPSCGNMPYQFCLPGGAFSVASSTAPPHSPPRPKPWPKRHSASNAGATMPALW